MELPALIAGPSGHVGLRSAVVALWAICLIQIVLWNHLATHVAYQLPNMTLEISHRRT